MQPIKILAVDDHISSLLALEDILGTIDAQIIKATSAKEALIVLLNEPINCVLLDVNMPVMDGFEFLKTLREAPAHAKIPVIMITGQVFSENQTLMAYKFGAVDFLLKPVDPEAVYRKVNFIVQQAKRIKSIEHLEIHLKGMENAVINPLTNIVQSETSSSSQAQLTGVLEFLNKLNADWKEMT